jgi:uncharacterized protein YneF (UPF0154 family)
MITIYDLIIAFGFGISTGMILSIFIVKRQIKKNELE